MDRFTGFVAVAVLVLVALGIVLVATGSGQAPPDETTPRGVVVAYLRAIRANEPDRAWGYLTTGLQARVSRERFVQEAVYIAGDRSRVEIGDASIDGDSARVTVSYSRESGPFGSSSVDNRVALLAREGGRWRISSPPEPYLPREPVVAPKDR